MESGRYLELTAGTVQDGDRKMVLATPARISGDRLPFHSSDTTRPVQIVVDFLQAIFRFPWDEGLNMRFVDAISAFSCRTSVMQEAGGFTPDPLNPLGES